MRSAAARIIPPKNDPTSKCDPRAFVGAGCGCGVGLVGDAEGLAEELTGGICVALGLTTVLLTNAVTDTELENTGTSVAVAGILEPLYCEVPTGDEGLTIIKNLS